MTHTPNAPAFTADELRALLDYDPETGVFVWRRRSNKRFHNAGRIAGVVSPKGYLMIGVLGGRYQAANLAWYHVHGAWPALSLDHINRKRDDNRIVNLREATASQQAANQVSRIRPRVCRGVQFSNNRFSVSISGRYVGTFTRIEDAVLAYNSAATERWGEHAILSVAPADAPVPRVKFIKGQAAPRGPIPKELQKRRGRKPGTKLSEETKARISAATRGVPKNRRKRSGGLGSRILQNDALPCRNIPETP